MVHGRERAESRQEGGDKTPSAAKGEEMVSSFGAYECWCCGSRSCLSGK